MLVFGNGNQEWRKLLYPTLAGAVHVHFTGPNSRDWKPLYLKTVGQDSLPVFHFMSRLTANHQLKPLIIISICPDFLRPFPGYFCGQNPDFMNLRELTDTIAADIFSSTFTTSGIINDINKSFLPCLDTKTLGVVLTSLLKEACANTKNNPVRVSARKFHNLTVIYIRYNDWRSKSVIETKANPIEPLIRKLGGGLHISNNKINGTTLSFTFVVIPIATTFYTIPRLAVTPSLSLPSDIPEPVTVI